MDGGLNQETLPLCARAGADVLVAGSAIYGASDRGARIRALRAAAEEEWERRGRGTRSSAAGAARAARGKGAGAP
jgi:hypothetical protein